MLVAAGVATATSLFTVDAKIGWVGHAGLAAFLGLALVVHFTRKR